MPLHCDFHDCHFLGAIKDNPACIDIHCVHTLPFKEAKADIMSSDAAEHT